MTPEQIVPVALFILFILFNLVGRCLSGRMRREHEREREALPPDFPAPLPMPEPPLPPRARVVTPPPALEEQRPVQRRAPRRPEPRIPRRLLGTPADARRAFVLIAVLGPCRALQPDAPDGVR
jgi:hypothetical protein